MSEPVEVPLTTMELALREELRASCWWAPEAKQRQIDEALRTPHAMPQWVFSAVRTRLLDMHLLQHRGQGNTPGFGERLALLERLIAQAPWVVDPDMGVLPRNLPAISAAPTQPPAVPSPRPPHPPAAATVLRKTTRPLQ